MSNQTPNPEQAKASEPKQAPVKKGTQPGWHPETRRIDHKKSEQ